MARVMSSRPRAATAGRRGFHVLITVLVLALLAIASGLIGLHSSRRAVDWAHRSRVELVARDVVACALEEVTHEVMSEVNRPGSALWRALRSPGLSPVALDGRMARTRELARAHAFLTGLAATATITHRTPLLPDRSLGDEGEWEGSLVVRARVTCTRPSRLEVSGVQSRDVRVTTIAPPRPLDKFGFLDLSKDPSRWIPPLPVALPAATVDSMREEPWLRRATLRVEPDSKGDVQARFDALRGRLGSMNGVIAVENRAARPLRLVSHAHRGKTVIVVRGALEIADVSPELRGTDLLTVVAFGDVTVDGAVEAALILARPAGGPEPARAIRSSARIRGSLLIFGGRVTVGTGADLRCDNRYHFSGPDSGRIWEDRLYVSVSPDLTSDRVVIQG
jgi:hypothetical protein